MLSPCRCSGSIRWIHRSCLDTWRSHAGWPSEKACKCDLCGSLYMYELQQLSWHRGLAPLIRLGLWRLAVILALGAALSLFTTRTAGACTSGMLLWAWALADAYEALYTFILSVSCPERFVPRGHMSLGSALWQSVAFALTSKKGHFGTGRFKEAIAQARAVTPEEAAVRARALRGDADQYLTQDMDMLPGEWEGGFELDHSSVGGGGVMVCLCCWACCAVLSSVAFLPLVVISVVRLVGQLFSDQVAVQGAGRAAAAGMAYFGAVFSCLLLTASCCPLPSVRRGTGDMPVVRSLAAHER